LANEWIEEVSVLGLSDPVWGQRVFAVMILKPNVKYNQEEFIKWCKTRMPKYSVPTVIKVVDKIAKNQLGKVNKKELLKLYENEFKK
jgi:acyl-CoA synthetase (AMP-forming)/AMP-acid ligase II